MNRLEEILGVKRLEIERLRPHAPKLERAAHGRSDFRAFRPALRRADGRLAVIAEVKKASPSAGLIAEKFDPTAIALAYQNSGADAVSVLTDTKFFQGDLNHLIEVRRTIALPVLRKDFVIDQIQIVEAAAAGADAVLLIVAALNEKELLHLSETAARYQLDALVEVHSAEELDRALAVDARIIGVNNRNLATFEVDLATTEELCERIPDDVIVVSESGIRTPDGIKRMRRCRVDAVLVGEALMRGEISIAQIRAVDVAL